MSEQTESIEALLREGESLLSEGNKSKALKRFESASKVDPNNASAWLGIGKSTTDRDQAIEALDKAIRLDPANLEARDLRVALEVTDLKEGVQHNIPLYQDPRWQPFVRPGLVVLGILLLVAIIYFVKDPVAEWYRTTFAVSPITLPTLEARSLPATWTPVPTSTPTSTPTLTLTPVPSPTPSIVRGRINGTASARSGPGLVFAQFKTLGEPTAVTLNAVSVDGKYYRLLADGESDSVWVSTAFVNITSGNPAILPVIDVPTPTPTKAPPTARPYVPPPPATPVPVMLYRQSKYVQNPFGPRCDRTYIHGTVWNDAHLEPTGGIQGVSIWLWVNGAVVAKDVTGTHRVPSTTPGYWEVSFPTGQAVNGLAAVVSSDGQRLSAQFPFTFTGGNCQDPKTVNEIILDFERIH